MAGLIIFLNNVFFTERNLFNLVLLAIVAVLFFSLLVLLFERKTLAEIVRDIIPRKS